MNAPPEGSQAVRVAVVDPLPLFQAGVAATLTAAGHTVETPTDVLQWAARPEPTVIVLTLGDNEGWNLLKALQGRLVVALLAEISVASGTRAVQAGARSVVHRGITPHSLERVVAAAVEGLAVVPAAVLTALTTGASPAPVLTDPQLTWLRQLADGATVTEVAQEAGYSERAMYRLLRTMYRTMAVRNKMQAIALAYEQGWLTPGR